MSRTPEVKDYRAALAFTWTAIVAVLAFLGIYLLYKGTIAVEDCIALLGTPLTMEAVVLNWYFKAKES